MRAAAARLSVVDLVDPVAVPAGLAVATFLAATPWLHVFSVPGTTGLLVVASAAAVSIPFVVGRWWRQSPAVSYAMSAAGLIVLLLAATGPHPAEVWRGLTTGPNRILTETLPLAGHRALLAGPLTLTWLCGAASAELVSRARGAPGTQGPGASHSGQVALGMAIPVVCFVVAYAVAASRPGVDRTAAPLLLVTLVGVAVLRRVQAVTTTPEASDRGQGSAEGRPSAWRPALAGGAIAVMLAVVLAIAVPTLPRLSGRPDSLNHAAPVTTRVVNDPVDAMGGLRDDNPLAPARTVLRVRTGGLSTGYLAAVVLNNYDGGTWSFDSTFDPTGGRVPSPQPAAAGSEAVGSTAVRQQVSLIQPLPVPFLPALDRPVDVTGLPVAADAATGMLLPGTGQAGRGTYQVVSDAPVVTLDRVPAADGVGGAGGVSPADLALPPDSADAMATAMRFVATVTGRRPAPTVAFLQAVVTSVHADERRVDPAAPPPDPLSPRKTTKATRPVPTTVPAPRGNRSSGTSLSVVINAVVNQRRATPEQFATFYAMVARYLGVPARVVTGFRIGPGSATGPVPAGSYLVTNRQAWTWAEIPVAGLGWLVTDPTPDAVVGIGPAPPQAVQTAPTTLPPQQANAVPRSDIAGGHAVAKRVRVRVPTQQSRPWWVWGLAGLGGLLGAAALLGPGLAGARRILRRRARRGHEPAQLAVGAWLELLDGLQQAGLTTSPADTAEEVAGAAGQVFGADLSQTVHEVGAVAERAMFSVNDPPDQPAAEHAWATQQTVRQTIHRGLDRRQRARAVLAVGSAPRRPRN